MVMQFLEQEIDASAKSVLNQLRGEGFADYEIVRICNKIVKKVCKEPLEED